MQTLLSEQAVAEGIGTLRDDEAGMPALKRRRLSPDAAGLFLPASRQQRCVPSLGTPGLIGASACS